MKNTLLLAGFIACFHALAQQNNTSLQDDYTPAGEPTYIDEALLKRYSATEQGVEKSNTVITKGEFSFVNTIYNLFGGNSLFTTFTNALYRDSTGIIEFSSSTRYNNTHAVGMTIDPTWSLFGNNRFAPNDAYFIDSVGILGQYRKPLGFGTTQGDSLIVILTWSTSAATTHTFAGTQYAANTNNPLIVVRTQIFEKDTLQNVTLPALNQKRVGIALTENDVTAGNTLRYFSVPVGQQIPGGNITGAAFFFKSAYDSLLNLGDIYMSFPNPDSAKIPNFRLALFQESNIPPTDPTRYFINENQWNVTSILNKNSLYELYTGGQAFLNNRFLPQTLSGYPTYAIISGTSTVGFDEYQSNTMKLYPNPAHSTLTLDHDIEINELKMFSIEGKLILHKSADNLGRKLEIDLTTFSQGTYLMQVSDVNGHLHTARFVKQ